MKRILITMTEEQHVKLKALAGNNVSGFIQTMIDKLTALKEKQNAIKPVEKQSLRYISRE